MHTLGNVKNKIPAISCRKTASQRFYVADAISNKAVVKNYFFDSFDCVGEIELGSFFETVSFFQVIVAQIIGETDFEFLTDATHS